MGPKESGGGAAERSRAMDIFHPSPTLAAGPTPFVVGSGCWLGRQTCGGGWRPARASARPVAAATGSVLPPSGQNTAPATTICVNTNIM